MYEGNLRYSLVMALVISSLKGDETTQHYLENAVRNLNNLRQIQSFRRIPDVQKSPVHRRSHQYSDTVPPLSLTKGELAAIYDQAVVNGETLRLETGDNEYVQAVVHHLDEDKIAGASNDPPQPASEDDGYYYYYYPIKSFLEEFSSMPHEEQKANYHKYHHKEPSTTFKPPYQYHSHHHEHNVTIQTAPAEMDKKEAKPIEPLFMAISGFIGMALMFVISMVILPKFGIKPKNINELKKQDKLDDFARLALNAIEGHCAERFACEMTKSARSFEFEDNRFYKLLKRVAPGTFGRYINSKKYANKQLQCTAIPCKRKKPNNNNNNNFKKPPNNNQKKKNNVNKKH